MENVKTFHVEGMACMHCAAKATVDLTNKKVTVTGDASDEKIIEVITAAGYKASRI